MFFGELKTESSLNSILTSSIFVIDANNQKVKISKGTIITDKHIEVFLKNNIEIGRAHV